MRYIVTTRWPLNDSRVWFDDLVIRRASCGSLFVSSSKARKSWRRLHSEREFPTSWISSPTSHAWVLACPITTFLLCTVGDHRLTAHVYRLPEVWLVSEMTNDKQVSAFGVSRLIFLFFMFPLAEHERSTVVRCYFDMLQHRTLKIPNFLRFFF